jgi:hypothetical protein
MARSLPEQPASATHLTGLGHGHRHRDWPDPLTEPCEPTPAELGLLQSQVPGHSWHVGRCLSGARDFSAACSCGWACTETGSMGMMLHQVNEHLDAVREIRGRLPSPRAPARDEGEASQREMRPDQRAREFRAAMETQQRRLSESLRHSTDLLSACVDQAGRLVAALEGGEWARTGASAQSAETVQHKVERARGLRKAIIAAGMALAGIAEDVACIGQDLEAAVPAASPNISQSE